MRWALIGWSLGCASACGGGSDAAANDGGRSGSATAGTGGGSGSGGASGGGGPGGVAGTGGVDECAGTSSGAPSGGTGGVAGGGLEVSGEAGWGKALVGDRVEDLARTADGGMLVTVTRSMLGWLVKFDAAGEKEWEVHPDGAAWCVLEPAPDGSVAVACSTENNPGRSVRLALYSASGEPSWARIVSDETVEAALGDLTRDGQGNWYLTGGFTGTIETRVSLMKFGPDGTPLLTLSGTGESSRVAVAPDDNVIVSGSYSRFLDFAGLQLPARGFDVSNLFIGELTPALAAVGATRIVTDSPASYVSALTATAERVCVAGMFDERIELAGTSIAAHDNSDLFVTCQDRAGTPIFGRAFGGDGLEWGGALALEPDGRVLAVATFADRVRIGEECVGTPGQRAVVLVELDPAGNLLGRRVMPTGTFTAPRAIVVDAERILIGGSLDASLTTPMGTLETDPPASAGFIVELRR